MPSKNISQNTESLNDLVGIKVVESNALIDSVQNMGLQTTKLFGLAVAKIDTENPPSDRTVKLSKKMLYEALKIENSGKENQLKKIITKMHQQAVFSVVETKEGFVYDTISPIEKTSFNSYNDDVTVTFTPSGFPLVADVGGSFTQYFILDLINLNTKYSTSLFRRLSKDFNFYENVQYNVDWTKDNLDKLKNPYISFEELREKNNLGNKLRDYSNFFKALVVKPAKDITENTMLNVSYETVYSGRKAVGVKFYVSKKDRAPYDYKLDDYMAKETIKQKQARKQEMLMYAMESTFTEMLLERNLIGYKDFRDTDFMASLGQYVYSYYEIIKDLKNKYGGIQGVANHLDRIVEHKIDYSKKNRVKYLASSAEDWVNKAKIK